MFGRLSAGFAATLVLLSLTCAEPAQASSQKTQAKATTHKASTQTKTKHARSRARVRGGKSYLVPPPPPYSPSILPELAYARSRGIKSAKKVEPEKVAEPTPKTIWSREGYEDPEPVAPNKYVTYWNKG